MRTYARIALLVYLGIYNCPIDFKLSGIILLAVLYLIESEAIPERLSVCQQAALILQQQKIPVPIQ